LWVSLVQTLLQIGYFYNPLLWMVAAAALLPMDAAEAEITSGAGDVEAEMQVLEALNEEIEALTSVKMVADWIPL